MVIKTGWTFTKDGWYARNPEGVPMNLPLRRQTPPAIPKVNPERAAELHRDGRSCLTVGAYTYDANGYKRWCVDCGTELGEVAYHEDGADVPPQWIGAAIAALAGLVLLVGIARARGGHGTNSRGTGGIDGGVRGTPTTYGPPDTNLTRPAAGSLPVVR